MDVDPRSGLTDNEKFQNYAKLSRTIHYLESGNSITEDWMTEQKANILKYREWIPNFSYINIDIQLKDFRRTCKDTEYTIQYLCESIRRTKTFDPAIYVTLLRQMKLICDTIFSEAEMEEMMQMMSLL